MEKTTVLQVLTSRLDLVNKGLKSHKTHLKIAEQNMKNHPQPIDHIQEQITNAERQVKDIENGIAWVKSIKE